jgi:hypothetical protein
MLKAWLNSTVDFLSRQTKLFLSMAAIHGLHGGQVTLHITATEPTPRRAIPNPFNA